MLFNLTLTGHYGDSPDNPNVRSFYDFVLDTNNEEELITKINNFVESWVTAERFECYTLLEHVAVQSRLRADILTYINNYHQDGVQTFRYNMTDDCCYVSELRIYPDYDIEYLNNAYEEPQPFEVIGTLLYDPNTGLLS